MRMFTRTLIIADVRQVLLSNASQTNVRRQSVSVLYAVERLDGFGPCFKPGFHY